MITPVVLIMASSSLILSTSQRLSRSIERTRKLADKMKDIIKENVTLNPLKGATNELSVLFDQLNLTAQRCRLLQKAMTSLYITLLIFISSCIGIVVIYFFNGLNVWIPVGLDVLGISFLFYASIILMKESKLAISAVNKEMDYTIKVIREGIPNL